MIRMLAIFVAGVSVGFIGSIIYAIVELGRRTQP